MFVVFMWQETPDDSFEASLLWVVETPFIAHGSCGLRSHRLVGQVLGSFVRHVSGNRKQRARGDR